MFKIISSDETPIEIQSNPIQRQQSNRNPAPTNQHIASNLRLATVQYIDPHILNTFIVLAECGQFTKAAQIVGLSQSAVTQQLQKLESLLDVTLVNRSKKHLQLTPQGEVFFEKAKKLLHHHEALISEFNHAKLSGKIRFGSPEDFASTYLPDILSRFTRIYPHVQLEVNCELTLTLLSEFERGNYDLIVFKEEPGETHKGALSLWKEPLVWAFSKDYPINEALTDNRVRLVLSPEPCVYRNRAIHALDKAGIQWEQVYTSPSLAGTLAAVRGGLGVTVLPINSAPKDLSTSASQHSKRLPVLKTTEIKLMVGKKPSAAISAFQSFIQQSLSH